MTHLFKLDAPADTVLAWCGRIVPSTETMLMPQLVDCEECLAAGANFGWGCVARVAELQPPSDS